MYSYNTIYNSGKNINNFMFVKKIQNDNVQGACGILSIDYENEEKSYQSEEIHCRELLNKYKTNKVFYKYGNNGCNCTLSRQEYIISQDLLKHCSHLPNFLRPILYWKNIFVRVDRYKNPFTILQANKHYLSCVDVAIFEYIDYSYTFHGLLKMKKKTEKKNINDDSYKNIIFSLIMQICLAIICAQQNSSFVHNDLHSSNILLIKCNPNLKILYRLRINSEEKLYLVNTYGYIPIIIDFGFSYSKECNGMSLENADTDNCGMITYQFDSLSDFIRFFVVVGTETGDNVLYNFVRNLFDGLPISLKNSWEKITKHDSMCYVENIFFKEYAKIFGEIRNKKYTTQILRLMMRNVLLPIKYQKKYEKIIISKELKTFFTTWENVDKWLKHNHEKIFVFREFTDSVRKSNNDIVRISLEVNNSIYNILNKRIPINIDWQICVNSFIKIINYFQNILYVKIQDLNLRRKNILYKRLKSGEDMFLKISAIVDITQYVEKSDYVLLIDNIEKCNDLISMKEEERVDKTILYQIFQEKFISVVDVKI